MHLRRWAWERQGRRGKEEAPSGKEGREGKTYPQATLRNRKDLVRWTIYRNAEGYDNTIAPASISADIAINTQTHTPPTSHFVFQRVQQLDDWKLIGGRGDRDNDPWTYSSTLNIFFHLNFSVDTYQLQE